MKKDMMINFLISGVDFRRFKRQIKQNNDKNVSEVTRKLIHLYSLMTKKRLNLDEFIKEMVK